MWEESLSKERKSAGVSRVTCVYIYTYNLGKQLWMRAQGVTIDCSKAEIDTCVAMCAGDAPDRGSCLDLPIEKEEMKGADKPR